LIRLFLISPTIHRRATGVKQLPNALHE